MGKYERNRGARIERQALHLLEQELGITDAKRNLDQYAKHSGIDILTNEKKIAVQVKGRKVMASHRWFNEVAKDPEVIAKKYLPMLITHVDRGDWLITVRAADFLLVASILLGDVTL